jgi:hypothetical protein
MGRVLLATLAACLAVAAGIGGQAKSFGQYQYNNNYPSYQLNRFYYYPYQYFPHNYWPQTSAKWPEAPGMPYMRPPAYQAYPPFLQINWRYEFWQAQKYYRGSHFWLDQF